MTAEANKERTFIMIKPDGVQKGLVGNTIKRFEQKGFKLVAMKFTHAFEDLIKDHHDDVTAWTFFPGLVEYMNSGPVVAMVWEGLNVVESGHVMLGLTNPNDSAPGSICGDYCFGHNICHGSDTVEFAKKEIKLWFKDEELVSWSPAAVNWVYKD